MLSIYLTTTQTGDAFNIPDENPDWWRIQHTQWISRLVMLSTYLMNIQTGDALNIPDEYPDWWCPGAQYSSPHCLAFHVTHSGQQSPSWQPEEWQSVCQSGCRVPGTPGRCPWRSHPQQSAHRSDQTTHPWWQEHLVRARGKVDMQSLNEQHSSDYWNLKGPRMYHHKYCINIFDTRYCIVLDKTTWLAEEKRMVGTKDSNN